MLIIFLIVMVCRGYSKHCAEGQIDRVSSFKSLALYIWMQISLIFIYQELRDQSLM